LQRSDRIVISMAGNEPEVVVKIQSREYPSATLFSVLQAMTQAAQATQVRVSTTMP
jgi:hypothetical protein